VKVLAIETATVEVAVAVADESGLLATVTARPGRRQVETLHPMIADACRLARITLADLDGIAVDIGPGLFTGLRVGVAAAKALGGALGLPVVTSTSLEVLRAALPPGIAVVIPVVDMRRGEVAWLMPGTPAELPRVGGPHELAAELSAEFATDGASALPRAGRSILLVGDGALRFREQLASCLAPEPVFAGTELAAPPVGSLAVLALSAMNAGRVTDPAAVRPLYGREADARINWSSRQGRATVS
jgi:tRNA threonylcarbamoyladenosine biosynthesis protein TsaB